MKITVLFENTLSQPSPQGIQCGHGLSLCIETEGKRILFDMGQDDTFISNAKILGIDIRSVDAAVISHGHYDHGGGLAEFLKVNKTAPVYIHKNSFGSFFSGYERYIGLDEGLKSNPRLIFTDSDIKIFDHVSLVTVLEDRLEYPMQNQNMLVYKKRTGCKKDDYTPDLFDHEQYMIITENGKKTVISGCCHKGCINIASILSPHAMVGGFHLSKIETDSHGISQLEKTASLLSSLPTTFYTCHCTGKKQFEILKSIMKDRLFYISTGDSFTV